MDTFIQLLQREIRRAGGNLKAEALMALALDMGLTHEDFLVACDSLFSREYHKDLISAEVREDSRMKEHLLLHLSRGGIYDQLPEGLFFQAEAGRRVSGAVDMAADHKRNKKKEEEIRRFFQPLENEFFWQRVALEKEEAYLLEGMQTGMLDEYFMRFWNIPRGIPRTFVTPLLLLLPYAHRIAGDLALMGEALEMLLRENVAARKKAPGVQRPEDSPGLGEAILGLDLVCQGTFAGDVPGIEWVVGPLRTSAPGDYLGGGDRYILLDTFNRFFVPAGIDTHLSILVDPASSQLVLDDGLGAVLGYSCTLTS